MEYNRKPVKIIYLLGAGRSGTTLLATILNSHPRIQTAGEMHQFLRHMEENKPCSCGELLNTCTFWSKVVKQLDFNTGDLKRVRILSERLEDHSQIPLLLLRNKKTEFYDSLQAQIFSIIEERLDGKVVLDSSKFIARYLRLKSNKQLSVKGIFLIRDVRGVISSFGKQVQTPKNPLAAILYYSIINFIGHVVCWTDPAVLKVRYEDFVTDPQKNLSVIEEHIFGNNDHFQSLPDSFEMPHIIGGNRMKVLKKVKIEKDEKWRETISRGRQITYYFLCFPLMYLNRYKI